VGRGSLDQKCGRRADFAAQRESLHQSKDHEEDRGRDPYLGVRRRQYQSQDGSAHEREGEHHRRFAAHPVTVPADDDATKRPRQEPDPKSRQRIEQPARSLGFWEEAVADLYRKKREGNEVVEFQSIAHADRDHLSERQVPLLDWPCRRLSFHHTRVHALSILVSAPHRGIDITIKSCVNARSGAVRATRELDLYLSSCLRSRNAWLSAGIDGRSAHRIKSSWQSTLAFSVPNAALSAREPAGQDILLQTHAHRKKRTRCSHPSATNPNAANP